MAWLLLALCLALAEQSPRLVLVARNQDRLSQLKEGVNSAGAESLVVPTDIGEEKACQKLIEETVSKWGRAYLLRQKGPVLPISFMVPIISPAYSLMCLT